MPFTQPKNVHLVRMNSKGDYGRIQFTEEIVTMHIPKTRNKKVLYEYYYFVERSASEESRGGGGVGSLPVVLGRTSRRVLDSVASSPRTTLHQLDKYCYYYTRKMWFV